MLFLASSCPVPRNRSTAPFRIACIGIDHPHGAGWRELLPHVGVPIEVTAIVPALGGAVTSLEEKYANVPRYATIDRLIDEGDFDGAIVCLPNRETPGAVQALAEAGKHILMEKPARPVRAISSPPRGRSAPRAWHSRPV